MNKKKIITDMILNIFAFSLPIAVIQLIVYPILAKNFSSEEYGLMISIYSIWLMISGSLSSVFATVRVIHNNEYEELQETGDFNVIMLRWFIINGISMMVIIPMYIGQATIMNVGLSVVIASMILLKGYFEIKFKIDLNYVAVVINNCLLGSGYVIGLLIALKTGVWEFVFLIGYLFSFIYSAYFSGYLKEKINKTCFYAKTVSDFRHLSVATLISNLTNYADKIVLFPLLGGHYVSIYYTSMIVGKIIGMLTVTINSVVLTYISKYEEKSKYIFGKILLIGTVVCCFGYFLIILVTKPIVTLLYPQWLSEVMHYVPVTTAAIMVSTLVSIIQPFVLKFKPMKWQTIIGTVSSIAFFLAALVLLKIYGLMGFCVGTLIGPVVKLICILFITYFAKSNNNDINQETNYYDA